MNLSKRNLSIFGGVAIVIIFFALLLVIIPKWQSDAYRAKFTPENIQELKQSERINLEKAASDVENSARVTLAQIIGGLALLLGLWFTFQSVRTGRENLRITEEGNITERFCKAVDMLGSDKLELRLGGIYALERLAKTYPKEHWTIMEVLTTFVRENSHKLLSGQQAGTTREDIQAIMTVLGRRKWSKTETQRLNLDGVNLPNCILVNANLKDAAMNSANLQGAYLNKANLTSVLLNDANLSEARLQEANLEGAFLLNAKLKKTELGKANLSKAFLREANLNEAFSNEANLSETSFLEKMLITPEFQEGLNKLQPKQVKEKTGAGEDSSENRAGE